MQFRQKALSKLQSPEDLDIPVRFARPQGLLVLAVTLAVLAGAVVWAVTGTVTSRQEAPGVLTRPEGSYVLQSPVAGQVTEVLAQEGEMLPADAPVLAVATEGGTRAVRTVEAGRVTSLLAETGSVITPGTQVATVERVDDPEDPLVAMLYIPGGKGSPVPVGARVDLSVQSAPAQQFGVLKGRVKAVGRVPQTRQRIASFLGSADLAERFSAGGPAVAVLVELERDPGTKSGYAWSQEDGPPFPIESTTPVSGAVHLAAQRPVDWLLP
ncbi:HlyD family efflux transporter periplasmic adaptor subunit [Streptomyces zingiberis]|uniref:HlyD family efflux transporter periplasmic adaptor subunit n=1 Tax=Streptomyces zingiberis TaxID=2053010 RepID=A0ABX1BZY9_9ACTN|nr:HlyD family efflux transporter periplasmic adaptor subunit [Streptomyces zingiberis]NJQ02693.1 HlyD family efflux transporter periplasmic adaptor subunit [Streptomyces zingiberis]